MIDIRDKRTHAVIYHSDTAQTLREAVLEYQQQASEVQRLNLRGASLQGADLQGMDLRGVDFVGADLRGVNLRGADLRGADLQCAYLQRADLQCAYLQRTNLRGAHFQRADLRGADLQYVDLQGAYLQCADLRGAHFQRADLRGADLQCVDLQGANLQGAAGLLPNGILPLQIGGSRHWIIVRQPGYITIGCYHKPVAWWEENYAATGRAESYTPEQIAEYGMHIEYCCQWMKAHDILEEAS